MANYYLDLSQFHLCPQEGNKPYLVFDPKTDDEYKRLAELLHIDEIAKTILAEGEAQLEREVEPSETADWSRIYKVIASDSETRIELKTQKGESLYVFMAVMVKDGRFTKFWLGFLSTEDNSKYLYADQVQYHDTCLEVLKAGHTLRFGGAN